MRLLAPLAVLSLLLAGCSGNADPDATTATSASSTSTTTGPPPKPVVLSDTLHLLEMPTMVPALPDGASEVRTPTNGGGFGGGGGGGGQGDDGPDGWAYQITQSANVTAGEIRIWIEITETLVQFPLGFPPGEQPCTWFVVLELGVDNDADVPCLTEPAGPINPGTKELVFSLVSPDPFELEANQTVSLRFGRAAFGPSTTPSVYVLSGSADHDSRIQLNGLKEAIED